MSFSVSGTVITQTGTDTDLSGLDGLTGVTTTTILGAGDFYGSVIYVLASNVRLVIQGTLTHTAGKELLVSGKSSSSERFIEISGVYNYGVSQTYESKTVYPHALGMIINWTLTGSQRQFSDSLGAIFVTQSGTFNWRGADIKSARSIFSTGNILISEASFIPFSTDPSGTKNFSPRIGLKEGVAVISDFSIYGTNGNLFGITIGDLTTLSLSSIKVDGTNFDAATIAPEPGNDRSNYDSNFIYVTNIPDLSVGNAVVTKTWQKRLTKFVNYGGGVGLLNSVGEKTSSSGNARGAVYCVKQVNTNIVDMSGTPVALAKIYIPEESDGNEPSNNITSSYGAEDITALENAVVHSEITDANGDTPEVELNIYFGYRYSSSGTTDNLRTKAGGLLDYNAIQYNYSILSRTIDTAGVGSLDLAITLIPDINITEPTKSITDAYSTISNANQFYDRAKSLLFDNYAGESNTTVNRSGIEIDSGSNNIIIDASASTAFAYNGSTITIKSSNFVGDLITTGTITFVNGATISGTYTDQNGTVAPSAQLTVLVNQLGCDVVILEAGTDTVLASVDAQAGNNFIYTFAGTFDVDIGVVKQGFIVSYTYAFSLTGDSTTLPITLIADRNYS